MQANWEAPGVISTVRAPEMDRSLKWKWAVQARAAPHCPPFFSFLFHFFQIFSLNHVCQSVSQSIYINAVISDATMMLGPRKV